MHSRVCTPYSSSSSFPPSNNFLSNDKILELNQKETQTFIQHFIQNFERTIQKICCAVDSVRVEGVKQTIKVGYYILLLHTGKLRVKKQIDLLLLTKRWAERASQLAFQNHSVWNFWLTLELEFQDKSLHRACMPGRFVDLILPKYFNKKADSSKGKKVKSDSFITLITWHICIHSHIQQTIGNRVLYF